MKYVTCFISLEIPPLLFLVARFARTISVSKSGNEHTNEYTLGLFSRDGLDELDDLDVHTLIKCICWNQIDGLELDAWAGIIFTGWNLMYTLESVIWVGIRYMGKIKYMGWN